MALSTLDQVSKAMMKKYSMYFVDWDDNRGEAPVNAHCLVDKLTLGENFWSLSLDDMCKEIYSKVSPIRLTHPRTRIVHRAKSCHFSGAWGKGRPFFFILGVPV